MRSREQECRLELLFKAITQTTQYIICVLVLDDDEDDHKEHVGKLFLRV